MFQNFSHTSSFKIIISSYKPSCSILHLCQFILKSFFFPLGSQTGLAYSRIGLTSPLYAISLTSLGHDEMLRLKKPRVLFAFVQILPTWVFHLKSFVIATPRYLILFTFSKTVPSNVKVAMTFLTRALLWEKLPLPRRGLIYWPSKFFVATLVKGHHMIIYANLLSNLSISFWAEDFQRLNIGKNSPTPWEPYLMTEQVCLNIFGRGSLDVHLCQSTQICTLVSEEKIFKELICIIIKKKKRLAPTGTSIIYGASLF